MKNMDMEAPTSADHSAPPQSTQPGGAVYPSLAAINTTWVGFINRHLKENLTLLEQLSDCKNLSGVLRVYGAYCWTAAAQYQAALVNFQQIGLNLASEVSAASLMPIRISAIQHEYTARSPDRAARDCFA
jgi:hypothetical protein